MLNLQLYISSYTCRISVIIFTSIFCIAKFEKRKICVCLVISRNHSQSKISCLLHIVLHPQVSLKVANAFFASRLLLQLITHGTVPKGSKSVRGLSNFPVQKCEILQNEYPYLILTASRAFSKRSLIKALHLSLHISDLIKCLGIFYHTMGKLVS